jgi:hypothetical protein
LNTRKEKRKTSRERSGRECQQDSEIVETKVEMHEESTREAEGYNSKKAR